MKAMLRSSAALAADIGVFLCVVHLNLLIELSEILSPMCMMKETLGLACPICGGTHAVRALAGGELLQALRYNWFVLLLLVYGGVVLVAFNAYCFTGSCKMKALLFRTIHYKIIVGLGILAGIFWILNNLILYGVV